MKILVTGLNGFVGHYLIDDLVAAGHEVFGAGREPALAAELVDQVNRYWAVDLTRLSDFEQIPWAEVDCIIHLAGLANVKASFDNPRIYQEVHTAMVENIFRSIEASGSEVGVVAISTGAVYGKTDGPVTELAPVQPRNPYAKSKLAAEEIVNKYRSAGHRAVNVRPFNHTGPGQGPGFLVPDLAIQIAEGKDPVLAGNLQSSRDYTDVRDVARAYRLLAEAKSLKHDVYNVCSGKAIKGQDIFDMLANAAGKPDLKVEISEAKLRATDEDIIVGSHQRLTDETGWQPDIPIRQTLQNVMESLI